MRCAHISIRFLWLAATKEIHFRRHCHRIKGQREKETHMKSEREGINLKAEPSGTGCVECLATDGWWLHLRRCAECGHIGCCDNSPSQHATHHAQTAGHMAIR